MQVNYSQTKQDPLEHKCYLAVCRVVYGINFCVWNCTQNIIVYVESYKEYTLIYGMVYTPQAVKKQSFLAKTLTNLNLFCPMEILVIS